MSRFLARLCGCLVVLSVSASISFHSGFAQAQTPIRIVVPVPPGGSLDVAARMFALQLSNNMGQTVVVENRPGADALIGVQHVARSAPDGRTLLLGASFLAVHTVSGLTPFNAQTDLTPVVLTSISDTLLFANGALEIRNLDDLKAHARRSPTGLNCGAGPGQQILSCEQLRRLLDSRITTIPYPGIAQGINALSAGHIDIMFSPMVGLGALIDAGKIRPLATIESHKAASPWEHLPLLKDTWPSLHVSSFHGIFVPAGTPTAQVEVLNREFNRVLANPEVKTTLDKLGMRVVGGSPDTLAQRLAAVIENNKRIAAELAPKSR